ncbi:MAG: MarR family transcriptional regulator [Oscillospiraceae bacterium]|nr:MarR family transcriptional regulator [Oscillospiraceae bacterium]
MPVMDMLDSCYLDSEYSVTEVRILYEIYGNKNCTANFIVGKLHIDKSYLSRILKKFEMDGILAKKVSEGDTRSMEISMTEKGEICFKELVERANSEIFLLLENLTDEECGKIEAAIDTITKLISKGKDW